MTLDLGPLMSIGQDRLLAGFAVFLRVGAIMALMPAFGERSVPLRVRLGVALAFTVIVVPSVSGQVLSSIPKQGTGAIFLATETISGLVLGMGFRLFVLALQTAGAIAAQSTSLSQAFGGSAVLDPQPAIGHMLVFGGLAIAVMSGLHVRLAETIILSYDYFPPGKFPGTGEVANWGVTQTASAFSLAFSLAAPFLIASLVYNVALGIINRAMPQLMVAFVGAPAITAGALFLMFLVMPLMLAIWSDALMQFMQNPFGGGYE